jgi:hypothetical protein
MGRIRTGERTARRTRSAASWRHRDKLPMWYCRRRPRVNSLFRATAVPCDHTPGAHPSARRSKSPRTRGSPRCTRWDDGKARNVLGHWDGPSRITVWRLDKVSTENLDVVRCAVRSPCGIGCTTGIPYHRSAFRWEVPGHQFKHEKGGHQTRARMSTEPRGADRRNGQLATTWCLWHQDVVDGSAEIGVPQRLTNSSLAQLVSRLAALCKVLALSDAMWRCENGYC